MDRLPAYLVTAVTVVMTVATVLMGITVPSLWSQRASITPSVFGYVLGTFDLSGRLQLSGAGQQAPAPR